MPEALTEAIASRIQQFSVGDLVYLYELDMTRLGGGIARFTPGAWGGAAVRFNNQTYVPIEVTATGFEWSAQGAPPRPRLRINNVNLAATALVNEFDDLVGAVVRRTRTFRDFLDDGATPDPEAIFPVDVYFIERLTSLNKAFVEWELSSPLDQQGVKLPARTMIRDTCTHIYRRWDAETGAFDYTQATCPYAGTSYFSATGATVTAPSADRCGKRLSDCRLRFGRQPLPTRAFPGMARVRV